MSPTVYLAGKIGKNDWRHPLVPGLRGSLWADAPLKCDTFRYSGPFFVACDHGCAHGPSSHGALPDPYLNDCITEPLTRALVIANNLSALAGTDIVFAYITAPDCPGTIGEIGWAVAKGKHIVMCFAPGVDHSDFWFWAHQANAVYTSVRPCCLPDLLQASVADFLAQSSKPRGISS